MLRQGMSKNILAFVGLAFILGACAEQDPSFSLLKEDDFFQQKTDGQISAKMDILWVIDNSGSMDTSQINVRDNFNSFIAGFWAKNYDYQIAVVTTEAYRDIYDSETEFAKFRDGTDATSHTGVFVITPDTPDLIGTFMVNIMQGITGSGDERGLQSMATALDSPLNAGFRRPDAFLAVIIVSDEDDISRDNEGAYFASDLHPVEDYVSHLEALTSSTVENKRFSVSSMVIDDAECRDELNLVWTGRKIGQRYIDMAAATGGQVGSLCGDFAEELVLISDSIISLATQFYLSRIPIPETLVIEIDGVPVPLKSANPGPLVGGYEYDATANSIIFYGDYIPAQGASIYVDYDPVNYGS